MTELFPSILPDSDNGFQDDEYLESELQEKEYAELRSIAADHPSDDVHGKMNQETLVDELTGLERL